jgi:hypothetical protein
VRKIETTPLVADTLYAKRHVSQTPSKEVVDIKAAVAAMPGRAEVWTMMGVMVAFSLLFASVALLLPLMGGKL